jgi:carboxymethylenebutenolidase
MPDSDRPLREPTLTDQVSAHGGSFDLHIWLPEAGHGPALLLIQEIFGIGPYIRSVASRLADLGYVVGAPDVFWRIHPHWAADQDEAGMTASFEVAMKLDVDQAVEDCNTASAWLEGMAETDGSPGAIGFCLGGTLSWATAITGAPSAVVSYYGSGVSERLDHIEAIECPVLLHFGGADPFIPTDQVDKVKAAIQGRPGFELVVQDDAGHAFDNHESAMFHHAEAAERAWAVTLDFLDRHLPVRST